MAKIIKDADFIRRDAKQSLVVFSTDTSLERRWEVFYPLGVMDEYRATMAFCLTKKEALTRARQMDVK